jgi:hypothetical protein
VSEPDGRIEAAPPRRGLSTGAKVLVGCGGIALLFVIGTAVVLFLVGGQLVEWARDVTAGVESQVEADERMDRLRAAHPFQVPTGGEVSEAQAAGFLAVTDDVWAEVRSWAHELDELAVELRNEDGSIASLSAGLRSLRQLGEVRLALAEVLERHGVSPDAYLWTGLALTRAHRELEEPVDRRTAPEANLQLAERMRAELDPLFRPSDEDPVTPAVAFHLAAAFARMEGGVWHGFGLDTLWTGPGR